ncbi:MAG: PepSY domain-containing protein [Nitrospira sp.]|nr:PepSY domain-containing protein [Nitrospira sp.]
MKRISLYGLAMAILVLAAGAMTVADSAFGEPNKVEMAAAAKVSIAEGIKTASETVSGTIVEAELEQKQDKLVWEVEVVTAEHKVIEVHIDAETGAVLDVKEDRSKPKRFLKRN